MRWRCESGGGRFGWVRVGRVDGCVRSHGARVFPGHLPAGKGSIFGRWERYMYSGNARYKSWAVTRILASAKARTDTNPSKGSTNSWTWAVACLYTR